MPGADRVKNMELITGAGVANDLRGSPYRQNKIQISKQTISKSYHDKILVSREKERKRNTLSRKGVKEDIRQYMRRIGVEIERENDKIDNDENGDPQTSLEKKLDS